MKKIKFIFPIAILSLIATNCQKEDLNEGFTDVNMQESSSAIHISYRVDGKQGSAAFSSRKELIEFLHAMLAVAADGHSVQINNSDIAPSAYASKDVVYYKSTDIDDYAEWEANMLADGYVVTTVYDKETGTYIGTAVKK